MPSALLSRLFILRHAHSSWALPGQRDHQRPLDERGRLDARRIGDEMTRLGFSIERIVCSSAVRAQETLAGIRHALSPDVREETSDDLYALGPDAYLDAARRQEGAASLLLIGHNPMVEEFAASMAAEGDPAALAVLRSGFPTAGLAVIELPGPLSEAAPGRGRLAALIHPKGLAGA
ncbi:SixA phosphatase family protein [Antarcticirhabdus aurantiaca]|uniref:Histidine phosphatase family protein n=1 Tax=Antarcticirhabdus aurantiaca TaxID=2606717 RepID=A0ACD4NVA9_9HYPH|nr:histidine phosphatase family protein [Antarcticirhabdus aurantiaca]WAJ30680.1 histidine phosphatase family protein [Jeongeuplla avenae]